VVSLSVISSVGHLNIITGLCSVPECTQLGWDMNIITCLFVVSLSVLSSDGT
jgi:hypothetical protein